MKKIILTVFTVVSLLAFAMPAEASTPNWDVTGNWKFNFAVGGGAYDSNLYNVAFTQVGSTLTGTGLYPDPGPYAYGWTLAGTVVGSNIQFTATYNLGAPGTVMHMSGTIASDGTMTGVWDDNYTGGRTGVWRTTSGAATEVVVCPSGTVQNLLETVTVPANTPADTWSVNPLTLGTDYILKSYGTVYACNQPGCVIQSDPEYSTSDGTNWVDGVAAPYDSYGADLLDLKVGGVFVNWGTYDASHVYQLPYAGTGNKLNFVFNDISNSYFNDTGNLYVDIYSCVPDQPPSTTPTNKDECKKGGWASFNNPVFENQGQCVSYVQANENAGKRQ